MDQQAKCIINFGLLMIILHFCYKCQIKVNQFEVTKTEFSTMTSQISYLLKRMIVVPIKNVKRDEIKRFLTFYLFPFKTSLTTLNLTKMSKIRLLPNINKCIMASIPMEPMFVFKGLYCSIFEKNNRFLASLKRQDEKYQSSLSVLQFDNLYCFTNWKFHMVLRTS